MSTGKDDKVFVYGYSYVKGASSNEERSERLTVAIKISNYAPVLDYIDTYVGKPRTKLFWSNSSAKKKTGESMKNNAKLSLPALSALGTSMAYASDDIPVVPASGKKDVPPL
ncbi:hypothetical protein [Klebsiella pneumoniae]|uniref:hypothetical protein n=1 Tax=Klebsiella pneumoniae TaxID=573 RepID=UPI002949749C|nr:hypothetical protein [Klebsiella pneumoniae]MDV5545226.1 hypothetical protein [Klebsiella pneumoniae]